MRRLDATPIATTPACACTYACAPASAASAGVERKQGAQLKADSGGFLRRTRARVDACHPHSDKLPLGVAGENWGEEKRVGGGGGMARTCGSINGNRYISVSLRNRFRVAGFTWSSGGNHGWKGTREQGGRRAVKGCGGKVSGPWLHGSA